LGTKKVKIGFGFLFLKHLYHSDFFIYYGERVMVWFVVAALVIFIAGLAIIARDVTAHKR